MDKAIRTALAALLLAGFILGCGKSEPPAPVRPEPIKPAPGEVPAASLKNEKDDQPPYVKLKRDKDGVYTWEISGKDVAKVVEADRALRKRYAAEGGK